MPQDRWHIPTSDEEIVGVFLEEAGDLLANIDDQMKAWASQPGDKKALTEIRRSFHTLKGSGRMVKALDLAEVAWKVEKVLNQAIAETIPVSDPVLSLVAAARAQIPRMLDAFRHGRSTAGIGEIEGLMRLAEDLGAGRAPAPAAPPAVAAARDKGPAGLEVLNLKLDRCMQRADEALHRSEMALQQSRQVAARGEAANWGTADPGRLAELDRLEERVQVLSQELSGLRQAFKNAQDDQAQRRAELSRLVDERVRARLAPNLARLQNEYARDVEEGRRGLAEGRFGWLALLLSALAGGLIAALFLLVAVRPG